MHSWSQFKGCGWMSIHRADDRTYRAGLQDRKDVFVDVGKLGFICSSLMALGLNGCTPVATNAALTVSGVNDRRNALPNTPASAFFVTLSRCRFLYACIS